MTALFSAAWAGTVYIDDMERGVMDRLLASPVRRGAMMNGTLAYQAITSIVQTLIVFGVAWLMGARFAWRGVGLTVSRRVLLTAGLRGAVQRDRAAGPPAGGADRDQPVHRAAADLPVLGDHGRRRWRRPGSARVARYNPLDWAVVVSRETLRTSPTGVRCGHGSARSWRPRP